MMATHDLVGLIFMKFHFSITYLFHAFMEIQNEILQILIGFPGKNTKHIKINNPKNDICFYGALQQKISLMKVFWA